MCTEICVLFLDVYIRRVCVWRGWLQVVFVERTVCAAVAMNRQRFSQHFLLR